MDTKYPHWRKRFRTTIWKRPKGITRQGASLLLGRARGLAPVQVALPSHLVSLPAAVFLEARLVWDRAARHYGWHLVVEDGSVPLPAPGTTTAAVDLGEIHPAAVTDGTATVIISCRALRANQQYTAKRLSEIRAKQARKQQHSRGWKRLQRRKNRFLAKQKRRARDMEHKVSRAVVTWAKERAVGTLVIGDVRDVADGKRLRATSQQKIGVWSHGRQRAYITYKAAAAGIAVILGRRSLYQPDLSGHSCRMGPAVCSVPNPRGASTAARLVVLTAHRDGVGCANLLEPALHRGARACAATS